MALAHKTKGELNAKLLILGDSSVGKSSLLMRYVEDQFSDTITTTVGIDYKMKKVKVDNLDMKLQIWDTAGQEKYRSLANNFYKNSMGVLLVFDLTNPNSFDNVRNWIRQIKKNADENVCRMLLANKADLKERRAVSEKEVNELTAEIGIKCFEVSAKSGFGVPDAFSMLAKEVKDKFFPNVKPSDLDKSSPRANTNMKLKSSDDESNHSKCC